MSVYAIPGHILESSAQAIVHPASLAATMMRPDAKDIREALPDVFTEFQKACWDRSLTPDTPILHRSCTPLVISMLVRRSCSRNIEIAYMNSGLSAIRDMLTEWGISSVAIPLIGVEPPFGIDAHTSYGLIKQELDSQPVPVEVRIPLELASEIAASEYLPSEFQEPIDAINRDSRATYPYPRRRYSD